MKNTLSVYLIVKNEGRHINRVLGCIKSISDEIVIVDTGSTDKTVEYASEYTKKILHFQWDDNFSNARNYALSHCTKDYVLWLDADDFIDNDALDHLRKLLHKKIDWDVAFVPYINGKSHIYRERLFKNKIGLKFKYPVHEYLEIDASLQRVYLNKIMIHHDNLGRSENRSERNIKIMKQMMSLSKYKNDHHLWYMYAKDYVSGGNTQEAIKSYNMALKKSASAQNNQFKSIIYYHLAIQLIKIDNRIDAMENLALSITHNPLWREPYYELAKLYYSQHRYKDSQKMLEICKLIKKPSKVDIYNSKAYCSHQINDWMSVVYGARGLFSEAVLQVNKVLKYFPKDKRLLNNKTLWTKKNLLKDK